MKVGYIILCRYNSSRLPGKILREIEGKPLIELLLKRLEPLGKNNIIVATSATATDDIIAEYCNTNNLNCYRGSLENVAERFLNCALHYQLDYAVRINGDNLFADGNLIKNISLTATDGHYDFVSNVPGRTFATGMSIEVLRTCFYQSVYEIFQNDHYYCEHVTLYLYEHKESAGKYLFVKNEDFPDAVGAKMAIDTAEDLQEAEKIIEVLGERKNTASWKEIIHIKKQLNEQLAR